MIFTKAKLLLWGGRLLGVTALAGGIWAAGMNFGLDRGYDKAIGEYQKTLDEQNKQWYNTLYERDDQWRATITNTYKELEKQINRYQEVEEREQELLDQISVLESTLSEIANEYQNQDLGLCNVSADFDRLLNDAHQAATTRSNSGP